MASLLATLENDLDTLFVETVGFATSASYTPAGGSAVAISVIFSEPHEESAPEGILFANTGPIVLARTSDLPTARRDELLITGGVRYTITEARPDGTGVTTLRLTRAPTLELYLSAGRALLQADDGLWYYVGHGTESGDTTLRIEQSASAAPVGDYRTDIIFDVAGQGYRFHLVNEDGVITRGNPTTSDETGLANLALRSTDGQDYNLSLVSEDGAITTKINQVPNP